MLGSYEVIRSSGRCLSNPGLSDGSSADGCITDGSLRAKQAYQGVQAG